MRVPQEKRALTHRKQLYCLEHGIQPDGYLTEERKANNDDQGFSTFFSETGMKYHIRPGGDI